MRASLALQTIRLPDQASRLAWLAEYVPKFEGTGIVYVLTKRDADQVAAWLRLHGTDAHAYYSGVCAEGFETSDDYRQHLEGRLLRNELKAVVATTALGMGYDKPDLGFVVHYQAPGSIVGYYQQVGRAGRAIDTAIGILMCGREDDEIQAYFRRSAFPREADVNAILDALAQAEGMTIREIEGAINLRQGQIEKVLKLLSVENPAPLLRDGNRWVRTPVEWPGLDRDRIDHLTRQREIEWQELQGYVDAHGCLMVYLARALDDPTPEPCGRCSRCLGRPIVPEPMPHELVVAASRYLRTSEMPLECARQVAPRAFADYGFQGNLPANLRAEPGRILSRWGDAGWGRMVADDKHANRFRDDLVTAMANMIEQRWHPDPPPAWVTCIPSRRHPELVPDFARRLAGRLGLPFVAAIEKIRDNAPQKLQANRYHQCRNLDGVFQVHQPIPAGPVLLVDDIVDSSWTLTAAAALRRRAGAERVFPGRLATTDLATDLMTASTHAQAVLLLTAWFTKPEKTGVKPLSPGEWGRFATWLKDRNLVPETLLERDPDEVLTAWRDRTVTPPRVRALLDRAGALGIALEKWERAGLWVLTRADTAYPTRLKRLLKADSPAVLFGCGNLSLLNRGGLAVVGSRDTTDDDLSYAKELGRLAADQGLSIISGGARGVDEAAMFGSLELDGTVVGVLADSLLRTATSSRFRQALMAKNAVLVSPFNPEAGFDVGNAMARNKYVYALSDAAVVVSSTEGSGGTWNGAVEDLKHGWVPLWVKNSGSVAAGNVALISRGARALGSLPVELATLALSATSSYGVSEPSTDLFSTAVAPEKAKDELVAEHPTEPIGSVFDTPYECFLRHLQAAADAQPVTAASLQQTLELEKGQVSAWLKRAVADGVVKKLAKPVRYSLRAPGPLQSTPFS